MQARMKKIQEIETLEKRLKQKKNLPHLYSFKHYKWSRAFYESTNKENFLCAANQISKSSTQIRKCIEWATNPGLWDKLWPGQVPNQFWYLYPNFDLATVEFYTKWLLFLPKGDMKNHPQYGWKEQIDRKQIKAIHFNSGVSVYFRAYSQKAEDIQAGTVYAIFCDEELPVDKLAELQLRLAATDGYFHMVFTATLGQDYWRRTIQPEGTDEELHVNAFKLQVSMYDCLEYEDGSKTPWTEEKIQNIIQKCGTKTEVDRRVWGKFVVSGGLKFESFDRERNSTQVSSRPSDFHLWHTYGGIDYGSGGERGHPAAIAYIKVRPDFKKARVFRAWRGDGIVTTAQDILDKHIELSRGIPLTVAAYDHSAKDLYVIASNRGITLTPADKRQEKGTEILNSLFKNEMLEIERGDPELEKLVVELTSVLKNTAKTMSKDDLSDAVRYAVMHIPWDWAAVEENMKIAREDVSFLPIIPVETEVQRRTRERRERVMQESSLDPIEQELLAWSELYED